MTQSGYDLSFPVLPLVSVSVEEYLELQSNSTEFVGTIIYMMVIDFGNSLLLKQDLTSYFRRRVFFIPDSTLEFDFQLSPTYLTTFPLLLRYLSWYMFPVHWFLNNTVTHSLCDFFSVWSLSVTSLVTRCY